MAKVVNKSQQVVAAGLSPVSAYSRVICVHAAAAGGGVWGFGYSPAFGQNLQLQRIDVTVQIEPGGAVEHSWFSLHRASNMASGYQNMQTWEKLIDFPLYAGTKGMMVRGPFRQFSWNVRRKFANERNRFGVLFFNGSTNTGVVHAFFEISEG